jgi:hypothetical protein
VGNFPRHFPDRAGAEQDFQATAAGCSRELWAKAGTC